MSQILELKSRVDTLEGLLAKANEDRAAAGGLANELSAEAVKLRGWLSEEKLAVSRHCETATIHRAKIKALEAEIKETREWAEARYGDLLVQNSALAGTISAKDVDLNLLELQLEGANKRLDDFLPPTPPGGAFGVRKIKIEKDLEAQLRGMVTARDKRIVQIQQDRQRDNQAANAKIIDMREQIDRAHATLSHREIEADAADDEERRLNKKLKKARKKIKRLNGARTHYAQEVEHVTAHALDRAKAVITGDRAHDYGLPSVNHARTARLFAAYLGVPDDFLDARDVCQLNILQKSARDRHFRKEDSLDDQAGYAQNAAWIGDPRGGAPLAELHVVEYEGGE